MEIYFYTHDLIPGRERLMPWRLVIEIAKYFQNQMKWDVKILSGEKEYSFKTRSYSGLSIISVPKPSEALKSYLAKSEAGFLFWPVSLRSNSAAFFGVKEFKGKKIAYFAGGIYNFRAVAASVKYIGFRAALPYIIESLVPKRILISNLNRLNFSRLICLTPKTNNYFKALLPGSSLILPGKDDIQITADTLLFNKTIGKTRKYFLYMGSPAPARGSQVLLKAFDLFANVEKETFLILLLRKDPGMNNEAFQKTYSSFKFKDRIIIIEDSLPHSAIIPFITNSIAVVLPFLLIPSEIPLTFFEVLSKGIPVITFKNGGTTDYLSGACLTSESGNIEGLKENLTVICQDAELRKELSKNANRLMKNHPDWQKVGDAWAGIIESLVQ